jgi:hypothetical protein
MFRILKIGHDLVTGFYSLKIDLVRSLKSAWNPAGILNPGAFLLVHNQATFSETDR